MNNLYEQYKSQGYNFFIGVPGSELKGFIKLIQNDRENIYIPVNREDTAVAIATGAYFAGKKPLVFLQNSGLGNLVNIVTSLLKPFAIKLNFLIGIRNSPFEHAFMHKITKQLINLLEIEKDTILAEHNDKN